MARKSKRKKVYTTAFVACEGVREYIFLSRIKDVLSNELEANHIKFYIDDKKNQYGGSPEKRLATALKNCAKYDRVAAWLDNDVQINNPEILEDLAKAWCLNEPIPQDITLEQLRDLNVNQRKPVIILARPLSIESVIMQALGHPIPNLREDLNAHDNVHKVLKPALAGVLQFSKNSKLEEEYYKNNLSRTDLLARIDDIPTLRELFNFLEV